jgi:uncharacterized protein YceK
MKSGKKLVSLMLGVVFTAAVVLSGCGTVKEEGTKATTGSSTVQSTIQSETSAADSNALDTSKEAKLVMYLVGDKQPDADLVYE